MPTRTPEPTARLLDIVVVMFSGFTLGCSDGSGPTDTQGPSGNVDAGFALEQVVEGLDAPVLVTSAPGDDRLFVVERPGRIRLVESGALVPTPFLDISSTTGSGGERGLLGLAFHPDHEANGRLFVNHTDPGGDTRIVEFTRAGPDAADPASARVLLEVAQPFSNHNGGHLAFGADGMLYIGLGDGGSGGDPEGNGQDPSTLLGSLLRIDVDGGPPYGIPPDNPFVGDASVALETWAYGLRNPWRFSFDRDTGDLYIADVGQNAREEVSFQPASSGGGQNYGWNLLEGSQCFASDPCDPTSTTLPVHEYAHDEGCSITGGYVYRGSAVPSMVGRYLFADFCAGWIRSFGIDNDTATDVVDHEGDVGTIPNITSFGEDATGELYVATLGGTVYRMVEGG